ncbi:MAG: EAL domain-containing protein, partial [Aquihabitans sp.]
ISAEQVAIELTETVLATDEHGEIATLRRLREHGCKVALDDFGTGWSSLSCLRDLPIDLVKLDRSFITPLTTSPRAAAMVEAIIRLGDALGLTVVAEGVETEEQFVALQSLGCHRIQGFHVSKPVTPEDFLDLLLHNRDDADRFG